MSTAMMMPNSNSSQLGVTLDSAPPSPPSRISAQKPGDFPASIMSDTDDSPLSPSSSPHVMALKGLGALDQAVKMLSAVASTLPGITPLIAALTEVARGLTTVVPQEMAASVSGANPMLNGMMGGGGPMQPPGPPGGGPPMGGPPMMGGGPPMGGGGGGPMRPPIGPPPM